ncbi:hypothetical protein H634G_04822 [Metarhizium anisopliae BRIP 53293]|uniref:Extracellular membrane protein CFEM domain-containing protein n=1 Tax=Metarhizium anisopliae BRIP 53293 TaxID=1291518 RepID=A0A0D9P397_METAN|nr:hypothetical protein H634G_04822 [Metarhizium anisopliae BRIP 53293]KJK94683.1 hypothetical protein H633G_01399 [Metarhizium anisopliae BRIP 53284]
MRFTASALAIGAVASLAAAVANPDFSFPDIVPMAKRQTSGPAYQCHASCGYAIQNSAKDGYCQDQSWVKLLDDCLDCALKYKIWQWYGDKVSAAAGKCGLEATPKPVADGGSSQIGSGTAALSTAPITTTAQQTSAPGQSTHVESRSVSGPVAPTSVVQTTAASDVAPGHNSTASHAPTVTAGASQNMLSGRVVAGVAVLIAVNMF